MLSLFDKQRHYVKRVMVSLVELRDYVRHVIPCIKTSATSISESPAPRWLERSNLDAITFGVLRSVSPRALPFGPVAFCFS